MMRRPKIDLVWLLFSVTAALSALIGAFLPLWKLELIAPQYPKGLFIVAHGYAMSGDIKEINSLNHYVGLSPLKPEEIIELQLFPFSVVAIVFVLLVGGVVFRGRMRIASMLVAASMPFFMLADLQYQLYVFGHEVNSDAPLDIVPFTPHVLGKTQVMNFHSVARPALGLWMFVLAALLVSVGPWCWRWLKKTWNNTGKVASATVIAVAILATVGFVAAVPPTASHALSLPTLTTKFISDAISKAVVGGTVHIPPGTYEGILSIDKPINLVGDGLPVIDGRGLGDVITINADDVSITGFAIRGTSQEVTTESAGVRIFGDRATIDSNQISDALYGIVASESSDHTITKNSISSVLDLSPERRGHTIYLHYSSGNVIDGNTLSDAKDGVYLQFSDNNIIRNNTATRVRYGTHLMFSNNNMIADNIFRHNVSGGVLMFSGDVHFIGNEIAYNASSAAGYGLMFKEVDDIEVTKNLIHHNRVALAMEGAPFTPSASVEVKDNLVGYNKVAVGLFTTTNVLFTGNTFVGNRDHVNAVAGSIEFKNKWSDSGRGNYWDDYRGYDADKNGVGDIKYAYRGVFDSLAEKKPILHAYDFTLARVALDMAASWFPIYRPEPRVSDEYPLMQRTMFLVEKSSQTNHVNDLFVMFLLIALPSLMFYTSSRSTRRRWKMC